MWICSSSRAMPGSLLRSCLAAAAAWMGSWKVPGSCACALAASREASKRKLGLEDCIDPSSILISKVLTCVADSDWSA